MKNIVKIVWSCWNKTDRFVAIFSTISIILLLCIFCTSCNAQPSINNIPDMEYNDASKEIFDYDGAVLFYPNGVIDFIYHTQDNEYIIEYDDPDAFDPDNMIYKKDGDYYYIEIHCDSTLFFEYLNYYNSLGGHKNPKFSEASEIYFIEEDFLENDESYYKLVKYATEKNL